MDGREEGRERGIFDSRPVRLLCKMYVYVEWGPVRALRQAEAVHRSPP